MDLDTEARSTSITGAAGGMDGPTGSFATDSAHRVGGGSVGAPNV